MLRRLWKRWKSVAHTIGMFLSRLLLTLFYCLILAPFGLGVRLFSDPLHLTRRHLSHWCRKEGDPSGSLERPRRQF
jgi:hypothetical protein